MKTINEYISNRIVVESKYNIFDEEGNKDGKIEVSTKEFASGGREYAEVEWEVENLDSVEYDDAWYVRATVVKSDIPRKFKKGWYVEFDLDKETDINDLPDTILQAVENDRICAWSSGHDR